MNEKPKKKRAYRGAAETPKPHIHQRRCNRCGRAYSGTGRLLCPACFQHATQSSPLAEGFDA